MKFNLESFPFIKFIPIKLHSYFNLFFFPESTILNLPLNCSYFLIL